MIDLYTILFFYVYTYDDTMKSSRLLSKFCIWLLTATNFAHNFMYTLLVR